jgi:hypothetical protein
MPHELTARRRPTKLKRAQIIRHVAEFPDHFRIAEIARGRVTGTTEGDRAEMTFLPG